MNISYNDGGQMFGNAESKGIRNTKKLFIFRFITIGVYRECEC